MSSLIVSHFLLAGSVNTHCTDNVQPPQTQLKKNWSPRSTMLWRTDTQKAPIAQPARVLEKPSNSLRKQSVLRSPGFQRSLGLGQVSYLFYFIVTKGPYYQRARSAPHNNLASFRDTSNLWKSC